MSTKRRAGAGRPASKEDNTPFGDYLQQRGLTHEAAAIELGCTRVYVSSMARGLRYPSSDLMWVIERWSKGSVSMQSWYNGKLN